MTRHPSLRTGLADFPHPALQLEVLPCNGLACFHIGIVQTEVPMFQKEGVRPSVMISPTPAPSQMGTFAQDGSKPNAYPLASFDPFFKGRQHPVCPHGRFHPAPAFPPGLGFSGLHSPLGHFRRCLFLPHVHPVSSSLSSLAPSAFAALIATMTTLTPDASFSPSSGIPAYCAMPSVPSASNHPTPENIAFLFHC